MREIIIAVLLVIVGFVVFSDDIIYTSNDVRERYYKVDKIEPHGEGKVIYNINTRDEDGDERNTPNIYDNLQIVDTIGAFDIGDEIVLVPMKIQRYDDKN